MSMALKPPSPTKSEIKTRLEQVGIMPTQQRVDIALIMLNRPQHLSADQLLALANHNGGGVSKATVYNTLGLFACKGLVREVLVDPNRVFYDSNTQNHHHLYNEDTGTLVDTYADCLALQGLPQLPAGTELVDVEVIIRIRNR